MDPLVRKYIDDKFSLTTALICWSISFVSGMMFLGFAEVIQLLTDIKYKKRALSPALRVKTNSHNYAEDRRTRRP